MTLLQEPFAINQDLTGIVVRDTSRLSFSYLFWALKGLSNQIINAAQGLGVKGVTRKYIADLQIPLPPLEEQERIVGELDGYKKVIDGANQVIANYKPAIKIDPQWPLEELETLCSNFQMG